MKINLYGERGDTFPCNGFARLILKQKQKAIENGQLFPVYYKSHEHQITRLDFCHRPLSDKR